MNSQKTVQVELVDNKIIRIFRNTGDALASKGVVVQAQYGDAVASVRKAVFERADNSCEKCGVFITWDSMEMHEKVHRGKGGEISIYNSLAICKNCHRTEHKDRSPRFGEYS